MTGGGDHCWELALAAAAHHDGAQGLHDDAGRAHEIFQTSTMAALLDGVYDGTMTYGELARHGDFGVGTFNHLDGEMVAVDGGFFHLHADGTATAVDPAERTPFACVAWFRGEGLVDIERPEDKAAVEARLDELVPSTNLFYAVRLDGTFRSVSTRTATRQELPYRPLVEATASQVETVFTDVAGTVAGFRAPAYAQGMTVGGYHLHFIDEERAHGGHVLDFVVESGTLRVDVDAGIHVELPETPQFLAADLSGRDVAAETRAVEDTPAARRAGAPRPEGPPNAGEA